MHFVILVIVAHVVLAALMNVTLESVASYCQRETETEREMCVCVTLRIRNAFGVCQREGLWQQLVKLQFKGSDM